MCLTLIEILFLLAGLWLVISGKIPGKFFGFLFGKGDYYLSPLYARLFGLLLLSPMPLALLVNIVLTIVVPDNQLLYGVVFGIGYDVIVVILAIIIARKNKRPISQGQIPGSNPE